VRASSHQLSILWDNDFKVMDVQIAVLLPGCMVPSLPVRYWNCLDNCFFGFDLCQIWSCDDMFWGTLSEVFCILIWIFLLDIASSRV
jgi:hypothetical protein